MTRVEVTVPLREPLAEPLLGQIAKAQATYGIFRIQVGRNREELLVEYDATRLSPKDALAVLTRHGIPVRA